MDWHKKVMNNDEFNSAKFQDNLNQIRNQFHDHPKKLNEFAVFKEDSDGQILFYFSPTTDEVFLSIMKDIEAETCDKPNLNNAKLYLGRFI